MNRVNIPGYLQKACEFLLVIIVCAGMLAQCKKNTSNPFPVSDEDTTLSLEPGRYIIRTKYVCPDGGGFILVNRSNYENLAWEQTNPENVEWQKTENTYIWTIQEIRTPAIYPDPSAAVRIGYSIYQLLPWGGYMMLGMSRPQQQPEDKADHGNGPTEYLHTIGVSELPDSVIGAKSGSYLEANPEYFNEPSVVFAIRSPTDSTYRIYNSGRKYSFNNRGWNEWIIAVTARSDGSNCDEYRPEPVLRNQIVGEGCAYVPNPDNFYYIPDACYITQLVLEKAD